MQAVKTRKHDLTPSLRIQRRQSNPSELQILTGCRHWRDNFRCRHDLAAPKTQTRSEVGTIRGASGVKKITYSTGNESQFTFDALGRNVKIVEITGGSTTSTKQFVWCSSSQCEERDGSGALTRQFFDLGEKISGTAYLFGKDHLGSVREMTNGSGVIVWQQVFDPYGVPTSIVSTTPSDFGYAGMYLHARSGLNLTLFRPYQAGLGRWLSRDAFGESHGTNLYGYVSNDPVQFFDPLGLTQSDPTGGHASSGGTGVTNFDWPKPPSPGGSDGSSRGGGRGGSGDDDDHGRRRCPPPKDDGTPPMIPIIIEIPGIFPPRIEVPLPPGVFGPPNIYFPPLEGIDPWFNERNRPFNQDFPPSPYRHIPLDPHRPQFLDNPFHSPNPLGIRPVRVRS